MTVEVHMDDLYGIGSVLRHTLEHLKHTVALKVEYQGTSGDNKHLKRQRSRRGDALELQPSPQVY